MRVRVFMKGAEEGRWSSSFELGLVSAAAHNQARRELQRRVKEGNGAREREMACAASVGVREYRSLRQAEPGLAMATGRNRDVRDSCACCGCSK